MLFRIEQRHASSHEQTSQMLTMGEIDAPGIDRSRIAYGIALALNSGIEIVGWNGTRRLVDIKVHAEQVILLIEYRKAGLP